MTAYRKPKRRHPERMCYRCASFAGGELDWGECRRMAEAAHGRESRGVYAYGECALGPGGWEERR